jgi:hypothetical protein
MNRPFTAKALLFALLACTPSLAADESGSFKKPKLQWTDPARLPPTSPNQFGPPAYVPEPNRTAEPEHDGAGHEFSLNGSTFRNWVQELCKNPPLAEQLAERRTLRGMSEVVKRPKNELGSFLLLLQNYEDDIQYISECKEARRTFPTSCRAGQPGPRPARDLGGPLGLELAADHPAGDLLAMHKSALFETKKALKQLYSRLSNIAFLDGSPESVATARKIRQAAEFTSTCTFRATEEKSAPRTGR